MFFNFTCKSFRIPCQYFFQKSKSAERSISFLSKFRDKSKIINKSDYRIIYEFPGMIFLAGFIRTRISVPAASVIISPFLLLLDETKISPIITVASASIYFLFGKGISKLVENIVVKMYVNKEGEIKDVIISAIDDKGRRIDRKHDLYHLINADFPTKYARALGFIRLSAEDVEVFYKLNVRDCKYIDRIACDHVLGYIRKEITEDEEKTKIECESELMEKHKSLQDNCRHRQATDEITVVVDEILESSKMLIQCKNPAPILINIWLAVTGLNFVTLIDYKKHKTCCKANFVCTNPHIYHKYKTGDEEIKRNYQMKKTF